LVYRNAYFPMLRGDPPQPRYHHRQWEPDGVYTPTPPRTPSRSLGRSLPKGWLVAGGLFLLFLVYVVVMAFTFPSEFKYDGVAYPVDTNNTVHMAAVHRAVQQLTLLMADNVCLACPHANVALQCIVWNDGAVWLNPVVTERSDDEIAGYELPFMGENTDRKLVHRSAHLIVRHDGDVLEKVTGGAAHCVDFSWELFDGTHGILSLP